MKLLVLGNEAIAQGALDAGISGVYAYPGTPSTEITQYIQKSKLAQERAIHTEWSTNEKTATEAALGMSYAGKRVLVCMKHVGLNVASDAFMNMAISGVNGGLVLIIADDPSMHSSQNEQDSRFYGKFALVPILEPSNQQEAYDITRFAFDLSEQYDLPVILRMVTRLSHSRSVIETKEARIENKLSVPDYANNFKLIPAYARDQYIRLVAKQDDLLAASEISNFNQYLEGENHSIGIITTGIAFNYVMENFEDKACPYPILKLSQYPVPKQKIKKLYQSCDTILVLEEGYPIIEERLKDYFDIDTKVKGRLSGTIPRTGELNPNIVAKALGLSDDTTFKVPNIVAGRPPELCVGCAHRDLFDSINSLIPEIGDKHVFGDIGCYALGSLPPFNTINTLIDMGASIPMAKGASDAGLFPTIAIIGDSTFTHSGMTGLLDAINENSPITVIISDNSAVAMTGGQDSQALGRLIAICKGLGVPEEHLIVINPLFKNHELNVEIIRKELYYKGISVIIAQRACVRLSKPEKDKRKELVLKRA
ncbi:MAG: indolepyruvate ferredoxin oxidoreductase [Flavobacteriales bacterium CG03_land_8_20_14_0_80_35_15]|nr:indolepyruvate ferredoxin oxidoreductase [Zetaproteobacteria bacterium]NDK17939.1 indolepyruvate ferredoxin oxidoreductase [Flavobacteriales bacterium]OIO13302.1 MAG: indolepyruvate ferredoxin oxidoreductase [Flavobacteriaceae bacterium CG1_02_35_72]PIV17537.1 MAG: indolepyruvate ferredoxin oxidoreductase [Flavobacteriales bacterium CG03_land_8_20_14_0_80_35_15]